MAASITNTELSGLSVKPSFLINPTINKEACTFDMSHTLKTDRPVVTEAALVCHRGDETNKDGNVFFSVLNEGNDPLISKGMGWSVVTLDSANGPMLSLFRESGSTAQLASIPGVDPVYVDQAVFVPLAGSKWGQNRLNRRQTARQIADELNLTVLSTGCLVTQYSNGWDESTFDHSLNTANVPPTTQRMTDTAQISTLLKSPRS